MGEQQIDIQTIISNFIQKCTSAPPDANILPYITELQQINELLNQKAKEIEKKREEYERKWENEREEHAKQWAQERAEKDRMWQSAGEQLEERKRKTTEEIVLKMKELEEREKRLDQGQVAKEKIMREKWELEHEEREKNVCQREIVLNEKEEKWRKTEEQMAQNVVNFAQIVHLNVGGKRFSIPKTKLEQLKGTYFESMLTTQHSQQLPTGELFIDRDRKLFYYVYELINTGQVKFPRNFEIQRAIEKEFAFFRLPIPALSIYFTPRISEGNLAYEYQQALTSWLPRKTFLLRYKASVDDFSSTQFHRHCDNRAPTLTVVRTSLGYLFGGYSTVPFCKTRGYYNGAGCFIFTLKNPHSIPPTRYLPHPESKRAIWCNASDCVSFGNGDFHITSDSQLGESSYTQFPYSYADTTGKGSNTFTNSMYFRVDEIEVYSVSDTIQPKPTSPTLTRSSLSSSSLLPSSTSPSSLTSSTSLSSSSTSLTSSSSLPSLASSTSVPPPTSSAPSSPSSAHPPS